MKFDFRIHTDSPAANGYWTPSTVIRRASAIVRLQGWKALWYKFLGETVYRRLALYEFRLDQPFPEIGLKVPVELGFLGQEDIGAYLRFSPYATAADVHARLQRGDRCFVARTEGLIVSVRWSGRESVLLASLGCTLHLAPGNEAGYGTITHRDFRRFGIAAAVRIGMMYHLREEGIERCLAFVEPENIPAIRFNEMLGLRRIGVIGRFGAGRRRYCFCRMNHGEVAPGQMRPEGNV